MNKLGSVYKKLGSSINSFRSKSVITDGDVNSINAVLDNVNYPDFEDDSAAVINKIVKDLNWNISFPARDNYRLTEGICIKALGKPNGKDKDRTSKELERMSEKAAAVLLGYDETAELSLCSYGGEQFLRLATKQAESAPVLQSLLSSVYSQVETQAFNDADKNFKNTYYATAVSLFVDEKIYGDKKDKEKENTNWVDMIHAGICSAGDYRINIQFAPLPGGRDNTLILEKKAALMEAADTLNKHYDIQWGLNSNVSLGFNRGVTNLQAGLNDNVVAAGSRMLKGKESGSRNYSAAFSESRKEKSKKAELCLKRIDKELQRIELEMQTAPWQLIVSVEADDENIIQSACSILNGCFAKEGYALEWDKNKVTAAVMPPVEVAKIIKFPTKEFPGFMFVENEEFLLKSPGTSENGMNIGKLLFNGNKVSDFYLPEKALNRHAFICGMTGSGKTNSLFNILENAGVPFLVIEPVKGEYRCLRSKFENTEVWTMKADGITDESIHLLQINPFWFPENTNIAFHVDSIKTIISSAFELDCAMPNILEQCMFNVYIKAGWNIVTNENIYEGRIPDEFLFPTFSDLLDEIEYYLEHSKFEGETLGNYRGALSTRLKSFVGSYKGLLLNTRKHPDYERLMNNHTIIELEGLADDADKCLVMGTVLIQYFEYLKLHFNSDKKGLQHIMVIEEAHRLFKNVSPNKSNSSGTIDPAAQLVDYLNNLMAEIRAFGEGMLIVDQSPTKISEDVIKNSGTKMIHRIDNAKDIKLLTSALLIPDDKTSISSLLLGETLIRTEGMKKPSKVKINCSNVKEDYKLSDSFKGNYVRNIELEHDYAAMAILSNDILLESIHLYILSYFELFYDDGFEKWVDRTANFIEAIKEKLIEFRCYDLTGDADSVIQHVILTAIRSIRTTSHLTLGILEIGMLSMFLESTFEVFDYYMNEEILNHQDIRLLENFFNNNIAYIVREYKQYNDCEQEFAEK
ncbi:MAG: ATP-binding protein [Clostridia bacterium]|nr:ATP-binding protein [Clostridia bacterium]